MVTPVLAILGAAAYYNLKAFLIGIGVSCASILLIGIGSFLIFGDEK